ncbi:MAG: hypothetical protein CL840_00735 [Crocinitomicaceae bacterium]|jgi:hypothetical protein|nr:hypothetical protein [Crocinitomicaceae bacterium]
MMSTNPKQIEKALAAIKSSPFYITPNYKVDFDTRRLHDNLYAYNVSAEQASLGLEETIAHMTPLFQRDNNKWTQEQQIRFVENLLSGCRSEITLFTVKKSMDDCGILDGLQRVTSVSDFILGKFPIFDDVYFEQVAIPNVFINGRLSIRIYEFPSLRKAVEFYISMNEGITHSPEDIQRARDFLATLPEDE